MHEPLQASRSLLEFVLPNSNNFHAPSAQVATDVPIAITIPTDLSSPKLGVLPRLLKALRAAMPKTSVDKNCQPPASEEKVRAAEHLG